MLTWRIGCRDIRDSVFFTKTRCKLTGQCTCQANLCHELSQLFFCYSILCCLFIFATLAVTIWTELPSQPQSLNLDNPAWSCGKILESPNYTGPPPLHPLHPSTFPRTGLKHAHTFSGHTHVPHRLTRPEEHRRPRTGPMWP